MTIPVIQSLVFKNSKAIVMPVWAEGQTNWGNLAHPDPYVLDTYQKYPIGTKYIDGDRVFHYGYVHTDEDAAGARAGQGLLNIAEESKPTTDAVIHAIAETEIVIADTTSTVNLWAGGYFCPMSSPYGITYRVLSSTATASSLVTLTLERGLIVAIPASTADCRLNQNQYSKLCTSRATGRHECSCMGVAIVEPVASRYQWIQTWGPCNVLGGDEVPGSINGVRMGQFNIDGTLIWEGWSGTVGSGTGAQMAGYVISDTTPTTSASWFMYLMIAC